MTETLSKQMFPYFFIVNINDFMRVMSNVSQKDEDIEKMQELTKRLKFCNEKFEVLVPFQSENKIKMLLNKEQTLKLFDKNKLLFIKYVAEIILNSDFVFKSNLPHDLRVEIERSFRFVDKIHLDIMEMINIFDAMVESEDELYLKSLEEGYKANFSDDLRLNEKWEKIELTGLREFYLKDE